MKFDFEMLQPEKWNEYILTNIFLMFFIVLIILYEIYFSYMNSKEMEYLKPYYFFNASFIVSNKLVNQLCQNILSFKT